MFARGHGEVITPTNLVQRLAQHPQGAELITGGQQDCHELLRVLIHSLHDDMVPETEKKPDADGGTEAAEKPAEEKAASESEVAKADRLWQRYLAANSTPIVELFAGQLQNNTVCKDCQRRSTMCAPSPTQKHLTACLLFQPCTLLSARTDAQNTYS